MPSMLGAVVPLTEELQDVGVELGRLGANESSREELSDSSKVATSLLDF